MQEVEDVLAGDHRDAVGDIDDRLATRRRGQVLDQAHQTVDRHVRLVAHRARVVDQLLPRQHRAAADQAALPRRLDPGLAVRPVLDLRVDVVDHLEQVAALAVAVHPLAGEGLEVEQRPPYLVAVVRERHPQVQVAVEAREHDAVLGPEVLADECTKFPHDAIAVGRGQIQVVDVDDDVERLLRRHGHRPPRGGRPFERILGWRRQQRLRRQFAAAAHQEFVALLFDRVEVADRHGSPVDPELEVVRTQAQHGLAVGVGDVDVDVDDLDVDDLDETRSRGRPRVARLGGGRKRGGQSKEDRRRQVEPARDRGGVPTTHGESLPRRSTSLSGQRRNASARTA